VQCTESPPRPRSALDNNLTQRLSIRDPIAIVRVKALVAATTNLSIAFVAGAPLPSGAVLAAGLGLGAVSYGLSIVLDTYALRYVGAAREAAYFSTAPFFGGAVAVIVLGDRLGLREGAAGLAMALGVIGLLRARHGHLHDHGILAHEHAHTHDEHHQHGHEGLGLEDREPLHHGHPHVSDEHHRHRH